MSISINSANREELLNSRIDYSKSSIEPTTNTTIAGITDTFKSHVTRAINDYCDDIRSSLSKFDDIPINITFKGKSIEPNMTKFIASIKEVANGFILRLNNAEEQIIDGVYKAYVMQDEELSTNVNKDGNNLE